MIILIIVLLKYIFERIMRIEICQGLYSYCRIFHLLLSFLSFGMDGSLVGILLDSSGRKLKHLLDFFKIFCSFYL